MSMKRENRKVAVIGCGAVGSDFAYAALNCGLCNEIIFVDSKSEADINISDSGENRLSSALAYDLNSGMSFFPRPMRVICGSYDNCRDADIVILSSLPHTSEDRRRRGNPLIESDKIVSEIFRVSEAAEILKDSGFEGIVIVASEPSDLLAQVFMVRSGFSRARVMGVGTVLNTSKFRYLLGEYFSVYAGNVHAYVMGGSSAGRFVAWSQASLSTKSILDVCDDSNGRFSYSGLLQYEKEVTEDEPLGKSSMNRHYGTSTALVRICRAVLDNERCVLTVSGFLDGCYGQHGVFCGVPFIVGADGISEPLKLALNEYELSQLNAICEDKKKLMCRYLSEES